MTSRRDAFYVERDKRTHQYGGHDDALERPVLITVNADIGATRAGQIATLALVNMMARVHRRIQLDIPAVPLIARSLLPANDLHTAAVATALAITPVLELTLGQGVQPLGVSIGLGQNMPDNLDLYLDWAGGRGALSTAPVTDQICDPDSVFGAATAAVLGAAALFRLAHGQPVRASRLNPIELASDDTAGTRDHPDPIDVGTVLVVGAGAIASGLAYWARELSTIGGTWDFVDADDVELHNTNRCMTMTAADAGWPNGKPNGRPSNKAVATAWAVEGEAHPHWYDEWLPDHQTRHDLVLTLANARGVRSLVTQRGEPVLLHATTSTNWTAELHRHVPDRDDCPACRSPDTTVPQMACSTGPANPSRPDSPDAALPFLSAAASLLLAAAVTDLPDAAALRGRFNHWQLDLTLTEPLIHPRQHPARDGCRHQLAASIRHLVQRESPRRWDHLDEHEPGQRAPRT